MTMPKKSQFPSWLRKRLPQTSSVKTRAILEKWHVHTVCDSARCPNQAECYGKKRATFMLMGDVCTRDCLFCSVDHGEPSPLEHSEVQRIVAAVQQLGLEHVVITSVTRDDLPDGGAQHFHDTIRSLQEHCPGCTIEVLTPDFLGNTDAIECGTT